MKRALFAICATVAGLYATLTYKTPAPTQAATVSPNQLLTEVTLPGDGSDSTGDTATDQTTDTTDTTPPDTTPDTTAVPDTSPSTTVSPTPQSVPQTTAPHVTPATPKPTVTTAPRPTTTTTTQPPKHTLDGPSESTPFGPVQVAITVQGSKIVGVQALQYPNSDPTSKSIESRAIPALESETLQAQSANIAGVSGATFTSNAWKQSLQAALHNAGL